MSFAYNEIEETSDQITLWKNPALPAIGVLPFKGVQVEWGQDGNPLKPLLKIRRILYPKAEYDRSSVEKIAEQTVNCPFCVEGRPLEEVSPTTMAKYTLAPTSPISPDLKEMGEWFKREWDDFWRLIV